MRVLTGELPASGGEVTYDGRDVHAERALLASRIGYVPQDGIVHSNLTAVQALAYAARLRLPEDTRRTSWRAGWVR
jgi:ABC transport system ATP-binding/permease protein